MTTAQRGIRGCGPAWRRRGCSGRASPFRTDTEPTGTTTRWNAVLWRRTGRWDSDVASSLVAILGALHHDGLAVRLLFRLQLLPLGDLPVEVDDVLLRHLQQQVRD